MNESHASRESHAALVLSMAALSLGDPGVGDFDTPRGTCGPCGPYDPSPSPSRQRRRQRHRKRPSHVAFFTGLDGLDGPDGPDGLDDRESRRRKVDSRLRVSIPWVPWAPQNGPVQSTRWSRLQRDKSACTAAESHDSKSDEEESHEEESREALDRGIVGIAASGLTGLTDLADRSDLARRPVRAPTLCNYPTQGHLFENPTSWPSWPSLMAPHATDEFLGTLFHEAHGAPNERTGSTGQLGPWDRCDYRCEDLGEDRCEKRSEKWETLAPSATMISAAMTVRMATTPDFLLCDESPLGELGPIRPIGSTGPIWHV